MVSCLLCPAHPPYIEPLRRDLLELALREQGTGFILKTLSSVDSVVSQTHPAWCGTRGGGFTPPQGQTPQSWDQNQGIELFSPLH